MAKKTKPPKLRKIETSESFLLSSSTMNMSTGNTASSPLGPNHNMSHQGQMSGLGHGRRRPGSGSSAGLGGGGNNHNHRFRFPQPTSCSSSNNSNFNSQTSKKKEQDESLRCSPTSYRKEGGSSSSSGNLLDQHLQQHNFIVSTIIPNFLFLGPEPCTEEDFETLRRLGIKRILNVATECSIGQEIVEKKMYNKNKQQHHYNNIRKEGEEEENNDNNLNFFIEKYIKIPFRDFVEEVGVQGRMEQANLVLDDASLHSSPVYVHCKAGKSRSVTIVLGYLIHRYRWTLKDSYEHVSERRKGICPNIGFLAELMSFEERVLGVRSQVMSRSMSYQYPSTGPTHLSGLSLGGGSGGTGLSSGLGSAGTVGITGGGTIGTKTGRIRSVGMPRPESGIH